MRFVKESELIIIFLNRFGRLDKYSEQRMMNYKPSRQCRILMLMLLIFKEEIKDFRDKITIEEKRLCTNM